MNSYNSPRADLEQAEAILRAILRGDFAPDEKPDAATLSRMLVHLVNMQEAIGASTEGHVNIAKRLGDFADTTSRMASRSSNTAPQLTKLSEAFRAASEGTRNHPNNV